MRIGELARRTGVSDKTIRYYERIGVLSEPSRTSSGYRDYDESAAERLRFVRASQAVGLKLGEIRSIVALRERGETPCEHVAQLIDRRAAEVRERIAELERMQKELQQLKRRAQELDSAECSARDVCHLIPDN